MQNKVAGKWSKWSYAMKTFVKAVEEEKKKEEEPDKVNAWTKMKNKQVSLEHYIVTLKNKIKELQQQLEKNPEVRELEKELEASEDDRAHYKVSIYNPHPSPNPHSHFHYLEPFNIH
jgi:hypothetical protein